jgi:hypothetical protein
MDYPQSGERIIGSANLSALRDLYPAKLTFQIQRISGRDDLWVTEYVIEYDAKPVHTVSTMEFRGDRVAHETLYFADPFEAPALAGPPRGASVARPTRGARGRRGPSLEDEGETRNGGRSARPT